MILKNVNFTHSTWYVYMMLTLKWLNMYLTKCSEIFTKEFYLYKKSIKIQFPFPNYSNFSQNYIFYDTIFTELYTQKKNLHTILREKWYQIKPWSKIIFLHVNKEKKLYLVKRTKSSVSQYLKMKMSFILFKTKMIKSYPTWIIGVSD